MTANSTERFGVTKEFLSGLWSNLLILIDMQSRKRKIEYFLRNTSKKERKIYENSMVMCGAMNHFPKTSLLAINTDLKGVWMSLCFDGGKKPRRLPYGTQCIILPGYEVINYLKTKIQPVDEEEKEEEESSWQKVIIEDDGKIDFITLYRREERYEAGDEHQVQSVRKKCKRIIPRRDFLEKFQKKTWIREDFLKHANEMKLQKTKKEKDIKVCPEELKTKDPLLFFEIAYYFNEGTQYARMVLISAWDIQVKWCRENLLQVPLHNNPVLQLKDGVVTTVSNVHPKLVVDVLVVGDIELRKINGHSWFTVRKLPRAGKEPFIAVLPPKKSPFSFRKKIIKGRQRVDFDVMSSKINSRSSH